MHRSIAVLSLLACGSSAAEPKAPKPITSNPCFAGKPSIVATEMWRTLEKYSWSLHSDTPPPPTTYGSCKVERNKVTTANGTLVAELGCGVRVVTKGVKDELGLELGALGKNVLARKHKPVPKLTCYGNGPDQTRCHFDRDEDSDTDATSYVVAGALGADVLTGDAAAKLFSARPIVEIGVSIWCH
jgi:hypothetical protein